MTSGMWRYYLYRFIGFLAPLIPVRIAHWIGDWGGDAAAFVRPAERAIVRSNIRHAVGDDVDEKQLDFMAYRTYRCMMKNYYDLFWMPRCSLQEIRERVDVQGEEHLYATLALGKGVIFGSLHYGNVEVVAQLMPFIGLKSVVPAEHIQPEALFQYLRKVRESHGLRLIPSDGVLTEVVRALRRGEAVGLALDRDTTDSGRFVEFFGKPAKLPDGAVQLALRTGAPILVCFSRRLPNARYAVRILPPIQFPVTRNADDETIEQAMRRVLTVVEEELRKDPSQWVVFRRVWND
jgi:lauroyl/myristoyl acyltransferase